MDPEEPCEIVLEEMKNKLIEFSKEIQGYLKEKMDKYEFKLKTLMEK